MQLEQRSPAQGLALAGHDTSTATLSSPLLTRCGPDLGHVAPGPSSLPQAPPLPLAAAPVPPRTATSLPGAGTAVTNPPESRAALGSDTLCNAALSASVKKTRAPANGEGFLHPFSRGYPRPGGRGREGRRPPSPRRQQLPPVCLAPPERRHRPTARLVARGRRGPGRASAASWSRAAPRAAAAAFEPRRGP